MIHPSGARPTPNGEAPGLDRPGPARLTAWTFRRKKKPRRGGRSQRGAIPLIPVTAEAIRGDFVAAAHVHARAAGFVSREPTPFEAVLASSRSRRWSSLSRAPAIARRALAAPFGFCSGGFSSTAGLRSDETRPDPKVGRLCLPTADQVRRAPPVFIRALRESLPTLLSRPFGRGAGVNRHSANRSACALRRRTLLPSACLPASVTAPLRTATGRAKYTRPHTLSSAFSLKNRAEKFYPFACVRAFACGKNQHPGGPE